MQVHTLCDHTEISARTFTFQGEEYTFEQCATCGLSPDTPPITASGPGELEPWWEWKPISGAKINRDRPGINRVQTSRTEARDQVKLLEQLVAWEAELGETPDPALAEELEAAREHRANLGFIFVAN